MKACTYMPQVLTCMQLGHSPFIHGFLLIMLACQFQMLIPTAPQGHWAYVLSAVGYTNCLLEGCQCTSSAQICGCLLLLSILP